jgi:hypothetical protein
LKVRPFNPPRLLRRIRCGSMRLERSADGSSGEGVDRSPRGAGRRPRAQCGRRVSSRTARHVPRDADGARTAPCRGSDQGGARRHRYVDAYPCSAALDAQPGRRRVRQLARPRHAHAPGAQLFLVLLTADGAPHHEYVGTVRLVQSGAVLRFAPVLPERSDIVPVLAATFWQRVGYLRPSSMLRKR